MAKTSHHVVPGPEGGWNVLKGAALRASKHFETRKEAVSWARKASQEAHSELVIHRSDGTVEMKDHYGQDPLPARHCK